MKLISETTRIQAAGNPPKVIEEFVGNVNTRDSGISIAKMESPRGWSEPGQRPEFDEYTLVLRGTLVLETETGRYEVKANQGVIMHRGEWVRYSTPFEEGAEYISVCIPAFSPSSVRRDEE